MGVPKFYRWISERYPCLSQVVKDYQIPEFDNFYLDMNGIVHICSHPNDDDPTFRISEEKIFSDIFRYLEALFRMITPQKVLFLAVDGVAPRAKMNQQRGRRFRSAREAQDLIRKALQKGEVLPSEPRFDSNCITPGTEFMARLHEQLKYFVNKKMATDPTWQKVEVVLSGQDVPGEGEHKIMDYIRYQRSQPGYDHNTRHCLYGLDADLMMLGLATHEPHFSLLREEVRFGKKAQKRQNTANAVTFHLLHLSIMREYIDFEFSSLRDQLSFGYDLEKIIDDWILMGFLMGNDFIPHIPNMHIKQEALPFLYKKYMEVLPTLDGYINEAGTLHMGRFEAYMKSLAQFDYDFFEELIGGMKWFEGKRARPKKTKSKRKELPPTHTATQIPVAESGGEGGVGEEGFGGGSGLVSLLGPDGGCDEGERELVSFFGSEGGGEGEEGGELEATGLVPAELLLRGQEQEDEFDEGSNVMQKLKRDFGIPSLKTYFEEEDRDKTNSFESDLLEQKTRYYQEKLGFVRINGEVLAEQAKCYVVGVQWVLHYYYTGVPSWSWFYPYHYAPFVSDIRGFSDLQMNFELCTPFLPFEQLLAVLPPASKSLLPKPYQNLMIDQDSPIKDYYPVEFKTDLNGKQQEWEAVVLIPFIDEERLLEAMKPCSILLSDEEVKRNCHGMCLVCHFDSEVEAFVYDSPWPQVFPDITNCKVKCTKLPAKPYPVEAEDVIQGLCPGVRLDVYFPGFPTLKHIVHTGHLEARGVRVFQAASRGDNMCLSVLPRDDIPTDPNGMYKLALQLVGKLCYVEWPYLVEAKVHAISDGRTKYYQESGHKSRVKIVEHVLSEGEAKQWREEETTVSRLYLERRGIDVGPVEVLVYAQTLQGKRYALDRQGPKGTMYVQKQWATVPEPHPYQTMVMDITEHAPEYREKGMTLEDLFPPKSQCFLISPPHYGSPAEVISVDTSQLRVHIKVKVHPEPNMDVVMKNTRLAVWYTPSYSVAKQLRLPSLALSRITGNIQVERGTRENKVEREKSSIGLNLKFSRRNQELLGYARKTDSGWSFSPAALDLLEEFIAQFPEMFQYIAANPGMDKYYENEIFPNPEGPETLSAVKEWLKQLPTQGMEPVSCGSLTLDEPQIAAIEKAIMDFHQQQTKHVRTVKMRVKPAVLFKPMDHQGNLIPDIDADYQLCDRVVNISTNNAVPFGLRGTVTGIMGDGSENDTFYEIVFDEEFLGGLALRCSPNRGYRLPPSCLLNISYGRRLETQKETAKQGYTHPGTSYSAALQSHHASGHMTGHTYRNQGNPPYDYDPSYHGAGPWGYGSYGTRSMEHVSERPQRFYKGPGPPQRGGQGGRLGQRRDARNGGRETNRSNSPQTILQKPDKSAKDVTPGRRPEPVQKTAAASEFSSMMKEMESHSKKAQVPSSQKHTVLRYSQQSVSKHRESENTTTQATQDKDTFSAAVSALSKLKIDTKASKDDKEATKTQPQMSPQRQLKAPEGDKREGVSMTTRKLSPSVASVFDSVGTKEKRTAAESKEASQSDSVTKRDRTNKGVRGSPPHPYTHPHQPLPPPQMPEAIQKLMHPPFSPRGPLLPNPISPYYPPRIPIRGPGYVPRYTPPPPAMPPPAPFGPPPMDPLSMLYQMAYSAGLPYPKVTSKETEPGMFVGMVEVGKMKFKGVPCPTAEEAKQSAAAVANSNGPMPRMPLLLYPAIPMVPPYMPLPGAPPPHYPGEVPPPGLPYYPMPPPLGPYHPRGPRPPSGIIPPSFVPLQVQRRQVQKSPQPKLAAHKQADTETTRAVSPLHPYAHTSREREGEGGPHGPPTSSDKPQVDSAKRNLLESLSLAQEIEAPQSTTVKVDVPTELAVVSESADLASKSDGLTTKFDGLVDEMEVEKKSNNGSGNEEESEKKEEEPLDPKFVHRLEVALESNKDTYEKLEKLTEMISALGDETTGVPPLLEGASVSEQPSNTFQLGVRSLQVGDTIAQAALSAAVSEETTSGDYQEAVQPSDTGMDADSIQIVGEIVATQFPALQEDSTISSGLVPQSEIHKSEESGTEDSKVSDKAETATVDNTAVDSGEEGEVPSQSNASAAAKRPKRQLAATFMHTSSQNV